MKRLDIEGTASTPMVEFDPDRGDFKIEGRSIPENPGDFYDPVVDWLIDYFKTPSQHTTLNLNLEYVNSGSSKYLLGVLKLLKDKYDEGISLEINWYYEEDDEAIQSLGEHYRSTLKLPFNLVEYI